MSINPKAIIENKAKTLTSNLGLDNFDASAQFGDIKNIATNVYDASGALSVLENPFSKTDIQGLGQKVASLGRSIPQLVNVDPSLSSIYPPSLNAFANGFGASLQSKADSLIQQVIPLANSVMTDVDLNAAVSDKLDSLVDAEFQSVLTDIEKILDGHPGSQKGSNSEPEKEPKGPGITIKNPLRLFNSVNAIFSLGVLTADSANNPVDTYLKNGADFTILNSGGGGIDDKRIQTAYDSAGEEKGNLEYFIDDFDMTAILASNSRTGATQAINFSFSVKEPYSMGIFLQALQGAAFDAGFENYLQAPYLLELDFVGFDDAGGRPAAYSKRSFPFKLVNIEFSVESGGSTYQVECIPWNEQSFDEEVQRITDPVSLTGESLLDVLSVGEQGLSTIINSKLEEIAKKTCQPATNYYLIRFPTKRTPPITKSMLAPPDTNKATQTDSEARASRKGSQTADVPEEDGLTSFFNSVGVDATNSSLLQTLKASGITDLNAIGASKMISDYKEGGDNPFGLGLYAYDKETNIYKRNGVELTISDKNRTFKFDQGTPITKIIEELVIVSEYGRTAIQRADQKGELSWFRIESQCYIISDQAYESANGEPAKIYVYDVVPYKVDASRFSAPNQAGPGLIEKAKHCVKTYNYIYSGKNEDVLGFDIKFDAAFYQAIQMDMGQLNASAVVNDREKTTITPQTPATGKPTDGNVIPEGKSRSVMKPGNFNGGSYNKQYGEELAKMFHNALINSPVDLITANLEIWGDPYFLPDSGIGNYTAPRGGTKNITAGGGVDHQRNEIDIIVNFRTPVDYNSDGTMFFSGADTLAVDSFSGVYQVITVQSKISNNKFTQTLELVRRRNQSTVGINKVKALVEKPGCESLNPNDIGPAGQPGSDYSEDTTNQDIGVVPPTGTNGPLATIRTSTGKATQVAAMFAKNFQGLIDELETEYNYEIKSLGGYAPRAIEGGSRPSYHASGLAIDINPAENPFRKIKKTGRVTDDFTDMPEDGTGSAMVALGEKYGLGWGGNWNSSTDAMHFCAAKAEQGSFEWPANGLIPGGTPFVGPTRPDGTDTKDPKQKTAALDDGYRVSGTRSMTTTQYAGYESAFQNSVRGESSIRPYFPTDPTDNLYNIQLGDKVKAISAFYTAQGVETSRPVTQLSSGVTYNEFGDEVNTATARDVTVEPETQQFNPGTTAI
jgi:hypothetical protein